MSASESVDSGEEAPRLRLFAADGPHAREIAVCGVLGAVLGVVMLGATGWDHPAGGAFALFALASPLLAYIDLRERRLPDLITLPLAPLVVIALAVGAMLSGRWHMLGAGLLGAAGLTLAFFVLFVFARGAFGFGDVKLGLSMGACLGALGAFPVIAAVFFGMLLAMLVAIVLMVAGRANWKSSLALGPYLIVGTLVALILWS